MPSRLLASTACILVGTAPLHAGSMGPPNVVPLDVRTPHAGYNRLLVSVTVCEPDSERCARVDDVMVDTGSTGLRLEASAVPDWLRLPPLPGPDGKPLAECLRFVHDTAWGPLRRADVRLGGLTAKTLPLQVIDDGGGTQPRSCPRSDVRPTSNGTLGVGQHLFDCQGACEQHADSPGAYLQDGTAWVPITGKVETAYRLPNPVSYLPGHDDGIVIDLPSPPEGGAREVHGTLTFGVGGADLDRLGASDVLHLDTNGRFTTVVGSRSFPDSYVDSGTEAYLIDDVGLPRCPGIAWAYCAEPRINVKAQMVGRDGSRKAVSFTVGNHRTRLEQRVGAADDVAETVGRQSTAFVWGAPFFFGRHVSLVMDGRAVSSSPPLVGPFYAFD